MDPFVELATLVDALNAAAVDYALCGAVAVAVHGAPRATQDIDVLVRPADVERMMSDNYFCRSTTTRFAGRPPS